MNENNLKNRAFSGFFWRFAERVGNQGIAFVVSVLIARVTAPELYGQVALMMVFVTLLNVFVDSGFGNALVQKKDADDTDFSTIFFFKIIVCLVIYACLFAAAPLVARFFGDSYLTVVFRVIGLTIIVSGLRNVLQSYVTKHLIFKKLFVATLISTIISGAVGIFLAYNGYGIWALVVQQVLAGAVSAIVLWVTIRWRPRFKFSPSRLKELFSYGWKLLAATLLNTLYMQSRALVIGRMYAASDLAFWDKGRRFSDIIVNNITSSINSVLFPVMSIEQSDRARVKALAKRSIKTGAYVMWPLMFGLVAAAEPLVRLLLTDMWLPAVPFLRIFCVVGGFFPLHTTNLNTIKALGRSDLFLKIEVFKKILGITVLFSVMWFGVAAIAYSILFTTLIAAYINAYPNKGLIDYNFTEQLRDMLPALILSGVMFAGVFPISLLPINDVLTLILQIFAGGLIYISGSVIFKIESFYYLKSTAGEFIKARREKRERGQTI